MPKNRRAPQLLATLFAVPVVIAMYAGLVGTRMWAALRPAIATFLGATVIGSIYAGEAWRRAPATPVRVAATLALAVVLVAPGVTHMPAAAAQDPAKAVLDAARGYIGSPFLMGAEGQNGKFDCSGLVYRVFKDVGELPRIGGFRMGATAYKRWFIARGRFSKDEADAKPGDLVVWDQGEHIGFYVGNGKALSALRNPWGVRIHGLHWIPMKVTQYLLVNWGRNDGGGDTGGDTGGNNPGDSPGKGDSDGTTGSTPGDNNGGNEAPPTQNPPTQNPPTQNPPTQNPPTQNPPTQDPPAQDPPTTGLAQTRNQTGVLKADQAAQGPENMNGHVIATLNLRETADTSSRIVGWVGSGAYVQIIGQALSPQGYVYYNILTAAGASGWVYSRWVINTPN